MSTVTFQNVCRAHTQRQVIIKMSKFNMFITAACVLFLIKLILLWKNDKFGHKMFSLIHKLFSLISRTNVFHSS